MLNRSQALVAAVAMTVVGGLTAPATAGGCSADVDGNGTVEFADILQVIGNWGPCPGCPADVNGDDQVNFADILDVIAAWGSSCGVFDSTELAGNPLVQYPHFEYVHAFNEGSLVNFAMDPTRFPAGAGTMVDLYIVTARDQAQWQSDNSLTDVRGAPQTETLGVATIQSSTIALTGSDLLSGSAGTGLGVGYDLVCDVNRNGVLDTGDVIDGFSDVAGFYVVHDITLSGPLAVTETTYDVTTGSVTSGFEGQNLFYPTNIGLLGQLPLVVVSHGNGHNYQWYDHIGTHLASYGYVVMSHQNNTVPGVQTAATTTLEHTDAFLSQLGGIAGGILQSHIDTGRITWIGHSRGGEGVAIAYDRIVDETWVPTEYDIDDIVLVSSIAPVDFEGPSDTDPHGAVFSLWTAGSDNDVNGCASCNLCQTFHLHDRAEEWRQSISLHGVGHGDFHNGTGGSVATGPCLVGRADTHEIVRGYLLPLVKHYVEGNVPARDFLWRQWEQFRPIGAPANPCVVVDLMFREDPAGNVVIDDYQTEPDTGTSSSGGTVSFSVSNVSEGELDDANSDFTNNAGDVMNGMTVGGPGDTTRGVVFEWTSDTFYQQNIEPADRDFSDNLYLTFRACQATRHPNTTAANEDLTFTITLLDTTLTSSSINIGAFGGGIEEPYQRTSCGTGAGWGNEFETIRIRLTDFLNNGSGLDLSDITAIRFQFGPSNGSPVGRIGLDEITLSNDADPPRVGAISIDLPDGPLAIVPPNQAANINVRITASSETIVPGTAQMFYRFDGGAFLSTPLTPSGADLFTVTLPGAACADTPEFYFQVEGSIAGVITLPQDAPTSVFSPAVGVVTTSFQDDFQNELGWMTEILGATSGGWERGVPVNDPGWAHDPASDADGSGNCYLTENAVGNTDVDNGSVRLTSPSLDLSGANAVVRYSYYLRLTEPQSTDQLLVEYNGTDGVGTWTTIIAHDTDGGTLWRTHEITAADLAAAGVTPTAAARFRFTANDGEPQSIVEAGLDAFTIETTDCQE